MAAADQVLQTIAPVSRTGLARERWDSLGRWDRAAMIFFAAVVLVSFIRPFFAPHTAGEAAGQPFSAPGNGTLLGTDDVGRDLFSRILEGARQSWVGAFVVIA